MAKLYIVPTPIGNLKDITLRAIETLKSVDVIMAEDTRQSIKLLNHFEIKKPLYNYHMHNEKEKTEVILNKVMSGENIALISDAGTPCISDPGNILIKRLIEENVEFEVLPGATAFVPALIYSGFDTSKFIFIGFLPKKHNEIIKTLEMYTNYEEMLIFYESPHRIDKTLTIIREIMGNREISVAREITKIHEEIFRGTVDEFLQSNVNRRGEFVIVVNGRSLREKKEEEVKKWEELSVEEHIIKYINDGKTKKEAIKLVALDRGIPKSEIYKESINL